MSWILSIAVACITGIFTLFASGYVADLTVGWYRISSFEGASGYFVVFMALVGGVAGFIVGLITSRAVAARPRPGFLKSLGFSCASVAVLLAATAGTARLLADIPPEIDGETLFLLVELRWPARSDVPPPASLPEAGYVRLGTATGTVVRKQEDGPLFLDSAHQVDGRWVVPGVVGIFTSRGQRVVDIGSGTKPLAGFVVPLPAHPGPAQYDWSDWLPHARPGEAPLPDQFTYRFRVVRMSQPIREDAVGPFTIGTVATYFYKTSGTDQYSVRSMFRVRYRDKPLAGLDPAGVVALIGGPTPSFLLEAEQADGAGGCFFVTENNGQPDIRPIGECSVPLTIHRLTSDAQAFRDARDHATALGWLDRSTLAVPGLYQLGETILDTRSMTAARFTFPNEPRLLSDVAPLSLSPDEKSFAWFGLAGTDDTPVLGVTNFRDGVTYTLPIRRDVMRYNSSHRLDPEWVDHHFEWVKGTADGTADSHVDRLRERPSFVPLPYSGELTLGKSGDYQSYTLQPGGERLRAAVMEALVSNLGGERLADESNGFRQRVRLDGRILDVAVIDTGAYVAVSMDAGAGDPDFMRVVGGKLDEVFATGRYDSAFEAHPPDR
jgi:hypothetical protein